MKKLIIIGVIVIIASIIAWEYLFSTSSMLRIKKEMDSKFDSVRYSKTLPNDYKELFVDKSKVKIDRVVESLNRAPIGEIYYNNRFFLQIYKLESASNGSLKDILIDSLISAEMTSNNRYDVYSNEHTQFEVGYKQGFESKFGRVYFTFFGDNTRIIKENDSVAGFYSIFKNFSIRYKSNRPVDIYGYMNEDAQTSGWPLEIMFLKKKRSLYLVLLSTMNGSSYLDGNEIYQIFISHT